MRPKRRFQMQVVSQPCQTHRSTSFRAGDDLYFLATTSPAATRITLRCPLGAKALEVELERPKSPALSL
jgi:hypothetical protein